MNTGIRGLKDFAIRMYRSAESESDRKYWEGYLTAIADVGSL